MLKRGNKIAALLIAAASIASMVPAMAATNAQKLDTKDGNIESAVAFSDGKYVYQGYKSDSDDNSIYYNDGSKDKQLDDVEDADLKGAYGNKYAFAEDGSDEYLVDLSNGSVTDDDVPSDNLDTAKSKLRTNLKKTDRYGQIEITNFNSFDEINKGPKFGEVWYSYSATPVSGADGKEYTFQGKLYGLTNQSGKYIDISTTANIYAYSSYKGKVVKIEDFTNDYTDVDSDSKLSATLAAAPEVIAQDKDNFYVKTKVNIYDQAATAEDLVGTTTAAAAAVNGNIPVSTTHTYIQKISKAQGNPKDDAYLPKTVASYEVTKGVFDSGDADDAYDAIESTDTFSVVNGQLLAIEHSGDNVKVTSINLKKDKVKFEAAKPASFTSEKVDVYLAEKDDDDDVDVDDDGTAYDIDVDGNVWVVADGKIYEFKDNEFTKVYSCDSSLDSISVYDEDNLIAWEEDGDIYSTVKESASTDPTPTTPAKVGWDKLADGTWNFYDATGTKLANKWVNDGGTWYYLKADGTMATGWFNDNGTWYYLQSWGGMKTGWLNDNGTWYYLQSWGGMATGWLNDNGTWYYLQSWGGMLANGTADGYYLGASGAWIG